MKNDDMHIVKVKNLRMFNIYIFVTKEAEKSVWGI